MTKWVSLVCFEPKVSLSDCLQTRIWFVVDENHLIAQTRNGRKIMNVSDGDATMFCLKVGGDMVAVVGDNRKLLVFKAEEIPTMARGQGVCLQKYKDGGLSRISNFNEADGFSFNRSSGVSTEKELLTWLGHRAQIGKLVPFGFPKTISFQPKQRLKTIANVKITRYPAQSGGYFVFLTTGRAGSSSAYNFVQINIHKPDEAGAPERRTNQGRALIVAMS